MTVSYVDTSALVRAYLRDEPDHTAWRASLLDEKVTLLSSKALSLELTAAISAARRARRVRRISQLLDLFATHSSSDGPLSLVGITGRHMSMACDLLEHHPLRSLDALHIATALAAQAVLGAISFVTCDEQQAKVARQVGLAVQTSP